MHIMHVIDSLDVGGAERAAVDLANATVKDGLLMRLLILSSEFPPGPGGIGTHAYQLARHLCEMGWIVAVATPQDYASDQEIKAFNDHQLFPVIRLRTLRFAPLKLTYRALTVWRQIRERRPDLILAAGDRAVWVASALNGRIPTVAVGYGSEFGLTGLQRTLNRWAFQRVNHVISISQFTSNVMAQCRISPRSMSIIPCGADDSRFTIIEPERVRTFRESYGFNQSSLLLLTVGNVTERKGQHVIIRALPHVLREVPDVHYLIAGLPTMK